jgi:hypothetical protein
MTLQVLGLLITLCSIQNNNIDELKNRAVCVNNYMTCINKHYFHNFNSFDSLQICIKEKAERK